MLQLAICELIHYNNVSTTFYQFQDRIEYKSGDGVVLPILASASYLAKISKLLMFGNIKLSDHLPPLRNLKFFPEVNNIKLKT